MKARPRERFSSEVTLTPAQVAAFARAGGDDTPLGAKGPVLVTDAL